MKVEVVKRWIPACWSRFLAFAGMTKGIKLYGIFILCLFLSACFPQTYSHKDKAPLMDMDKGEVFIYFQPMPPGMSGLCFSIEQISAVQDNGVEIPLTLSVNELRVTEISGAQKLLASGITRPGSYTGISISVKKASIRGEEGDVALLVAEKPVLIRNPFQVTEKKAFTLFLSLNPSKSITEGFSFTPDFSLKGQERRLINLTGYITNTESNVITVFNKKSMEITGMISTGRSPRGIVMDQNRGRAYVAVSGEDAVEVIDVLRGEIIGRIKLSFGDKPAELGITPDGKTLVSVNQGSNTMSIIDTFFMFEIKRIRVGEGPTSVVIDPLGLKAYILNSLSNSISVIDISQKVLSATIAVEEAPFRGGFNRNGNRLYVISRDSPELLSVNTSGLTVDRKIFIGTGALSIKVDTQTDLIFVGSRLGGEISVVDPFSLMFIDSVWVEGTAAYMTIDDEENTLFVVLPDRKALQKINLVSKDIMAELEVQKDAYAVIVTGER